MENVVTINDARLQMEFVNDAHFCDWSWLVWEGN